MKKVWQGIVFPIFIYIVGAILPISIFELCGIEIDIVVSMLVGSIISFIILFVYSKYNENLVVDLCFRDEKKIDIRRLIYILPIGFSFSIACNYLINISNLDKIFPGGDQVTENLLKVNLVLGLLTGGIVVPMLEEVIFRGYIYKSLKGAYNKKIALIISSLIFAIIHGNVTQGIYAFLSGFLFVYLYDECENILAPILVHVIANVSILFLGVGGVDIGNMKFMHKILMIIVCSMILYMSLYRFNEFSIKGEEYEKK